MRRFPTGVQRRLSALLAMVAAAGLGTAVRAASDACAGATLVSVPATLTGTTAGTTADGSDSCAGCSSPDVWIRFTSPADQSILATLCGGATWDTLLSLHSGCPGNVASLIACNDDTCSRQSSLRVNVVAGATYYLRITGWCGASGSYTLDLSYLPQLPPPAEGPDVIVGDITNSLRYTPVGSISAYSFGTTSCNIGSADANWDADTPGHPLVHQSMFRLKDGRFEQLGQSWLKHTFGTIDDGICGSCNGHLGQILGVGCSDPYVASQNGDRNLLGPKWEVNATTGVYPYPYTSPPWSGTIARRLQVPTADIDPALNPGASYFVEIQYVTADDAQAGNGLNNASYRRITFASATSTPALTGGVFREEPVINAWRAADPAVVQVNADYLDSGITARFIVAARVTDVGGGNWDYEYAVRNLNSHRSGRTFSVPHPTEVTPSNVGFRDVAYHSGDGPGSIDYSGTDWTTSSTSDRLTWSTQTFSENASANALRWGTMYNFRFRSSRAPTTGAAIIGLFRPGTGPEDPAEVVASGLPVPGLPPCPADFNASGSVSVQDVFDFLAAYFGSDPDADFNGVGGLSVQDIFDFLAAYFAGCD